MKMSEPSVSVSHLQEKENILWLGLSKPISLLYLELWDDRDKGCEVYKFFDIITFTFFFF